MGERERELTRESEGVTSRVDLVMFGAVRRKWSFFARWRVLSAGGDSAVC